jgi:hypothetical protein
VSNHSALLLPLDDPWAAERYVPPVSHRAPAAMPVLYAEHRQTVRRVGLGVLVAALALLAVGFVLGQPILREYPAHLNRPTAVAGMAMLTDPYHTALATKLHDKLATVAGVDETSAAFYASDADPTRPVLVLAGTAFDLFPGRDIDRAFTALDGKLVGVTAVDPGFMGGTAKCAQTPDGAQSVCVWGDHGSTGIVFGYGRDVLDTASLMRDIRAEILFRP